MGVRAPAIAPPVQQALEIASTIRISSRSAGEAPGHRRPPVTWAVVAHAVVLWRSHAAPSLPQHFPEPRHITRDLHEKVGRVVRVLRGVPDIGLPSRGPCPGFRRQHPIATAAKKSTPGSPLPSGRFTTMARPAVLGRRPDSTTCRRGRARPLAGGRPCVDGRAAPAAGRPAAAPAAGVAAAAPTPDALVAAVSTWAAQEATALPAIAASPTATAVITNAFRWAMPASFIATRPRRSSARCKRWCRGSRPLAGHDHRRSPGAFEEELVDVATPPLRHGLEGEVVEDEQVVTDVSFWAGLGLTRVVEAALAKRPGHVVGARTLRHNHAGRRGDRGRSR